MSQLWQDLVVGNPMLIEIQRFKRKFMMTGSSQSTGAVVMGLAALCYFGLLVCVVNWLGDIPPIVIEYIQLVVLTLIIPTLLYGAISGEREKRTWDLLMVAPITKGQIVVGKFLGAMAAILGVSVLFLIPILFTGLSYKGQESDFGDALMGEIMVLSWTAVLAAVTIFISARTRRPFMALGIVLGGLALILIVFPLLSSMLLGSMRSMGGSFETLFFLHPFIALAMMATSQQPYESRMIDSSLFGWPQIFTYLVLTVVFLAWAERTLTFAENDVRFIPKAHNDA